MKAPLSWLKKYVDITLSPKTLGERLTEVGLGTEKIIKEGDDTIFEFEITPNRPDLLSIIGIAREIAALEKTKIKLNEYTIPTPKKKSLSLKLKTDYALFYRWTGICIANIIIKPSPKWLEERLIKVGLRPINNIIDITNYVMFELGIPFHAFDYDQIKGAEMTVLEAKGGESFTTVDEKTYYLPKGAIIIKDKERIIDLAGIKGGLNSGITQNTKNIFLHATVDDPIHIRKTSQALALRSDASAIYERGVDKDGTLKALERAANLVLELTGGEIASEIYDLKTEDFKPWKITLPINKLSMILGIKIPEKEIIDILTYLNLSPKITKWIIEVTIPTYRNDLKIQEDIIEEIARLYGYNNFPKTMPIGEVPTKNPPYFKSYKLEERAKQFLVAGGFSEVYTYSLISEADLNSLGIDSINAIRVDNPVSREYEYLRPTIKSNLIKALYQNKANFNEINLFEIGKVYKGKTVDKAEEYYVLSGISNNKTFYEVKGLLGRMFADLGTDYDPTENIEIIEDGVFFEINFSASLEKMQNKKVFSPIPKYPSITEDVTIIVNQKVKIGDIIQEIKKQSPLIIDVSLLDQFEDSKTFHIIYQHKEKNLTDEEVAKIREKIIKSLKEKFGVKLKE
ncbi:MAG: phenylalanine--tRNA ligase subunit beta [Candidatus Levybacteria bacterium]|nr:phenylalanine--tRNA ligase subunit beta [Candidatus Levybacteria bacterium]